MAPRSDLSVTALYTSAAWRWAGFPCSELFASPEADKVFAATNGALELARKLRRDLPDRPASLAQRHALLDAWLDELAPTQVVELAAGLSPRGAARSVDKDVDYVEVDLPDVVAHKRRLLEGTEAGRAVLARPSLRFVAADVTTLDLAELVAAPTPRLAVLAEGLFMYLPAPVQRELTARIAALLAANSPEGMLALDLTPTPEEPPPGAVGRVLGGMMKLFTRGRTFEKDTRTRAEIVADLRAAGFAHVEVVDTSAVAVERGLPYADRPTQAVLFRCRVR